MEIQVVNCCQVAWLISFAWNLCLSTVLVRPRCRRLTFRAKVSEFRYMAVRDISLDRPLPDNLDAERFVLGAVMSDDSSFLQVAGHADR